MRCINKHYVKLAQATGQAGQDDPLKRRILEVLSANKHIQPDITASSEDGIKVRGNFFFYFHIRHTTRHLHTLMMKSLSMFI